ncbi:hypothetical protein BAE44_0004403, partial [Dichanthelium oligosanthes]
LVLEPVRAATIGKRREHPLPPLPCKQRMDCNGTGTAHKS